MFIIKHYLKNSFIKNIIVFILFILISTLFIQKYHFLTNEMPSRHGDDAAYFNTAFNLKKFNVASHQVEEFRVNNHKNSIKPPFYSFVLSLFLDVDGIFKSVSLECVYSEKIKKECFEFVQKAKKINVYIHFIHSLILFFLIFFFTRNSYLSLFGSLTILFSTYFLKTTNYFMTENLSGILLLLHSFLLYLFFNNKSNLLYLIFSSFFLSILILTKAIFIYWFYLLIFIFLLIIIARHILNFLKLNNPYFFYHLDIWNLLVFFSIVIIIITPWQFRNLIDQGKFKISLQGGNVISERAEYLKTDMEDIKAGIIFYIPSKTLKKNFKSILSEKSYMFDEANKNSHYRNSDNYEKGHVLSKLDWKDKDNSDKIFEKSLQLIFDEPIKHIYLSFMFFVRGIFHETMNNGYPFLLKLTSSIIHWSSTIFLPFIFTISLILRSKIFVLSMPCIFVIFAYSFFTDFEPRYGSVIVSSYILILTYLINNMIRSKNK